MCKHWRQRGRLAFATFTCFVALSCGQSNLRSNQPSDDAGSNVGSIVPLPNVPGGHLAGRVGSVDQQAQSAAVDGTGGDGTALGLPEDMGNLSRSEHADRNGYVAKYECRKGNEHCDVDVSGLTTEPCQVTIRPGDSASALKDKLNGTSRIICVAPGDYLGTNLTSGTWTVTTSGKATAYRVLRATVVGDPWKQPLAKRGRLRRLEIFGSYWLVDSLSFPGLPDTDGGFGRIHSRGGSQHQVFNRMLVEGTGKGSHYGGYGSNCRDSPNDYSDIAVQNSVFRSLGPLEPKREAIAIGWPCGTENFYAVNNEIYDWVSHPIQLGHNCARETCTQRVQIRNMVVENNDLYVTPAIYTNCEGEFDPKGNCAATESLLSLKVATTAGHTTKIMHNRFWGRRSWDGKLCCNGDGGQSSGNYDNNDYILFLNNIFMDAQGGINNVADHNSYIGNIFYQIKRFRPDKGTFAIGMWKSHDGANLNEAYLNTFIDVEDLGRGIEGEHIDSRCNLLDANAASANEQLCFYRKLRTKPEEICIPHGKLELASLSAECQKGVGEEKSFGVDDRIWNPVDVTINGSN